MNAETPIPPLPAELAAGVDAPKIPVPAWLYTLVAVLVLPVTVTWLLDGDFRTALATALTALGGKLVVDQQVAKANVAKVEQTKQAATTAVLDHRDANLTLGYAQGQADAEAVAAAQADTIAENAVGAYRAQVQHRREQLRDLARERAAAR